MIPLKQFLMAHRKDIGFAVCMAGMYGATASSIIITPRASEEFKKAPTKKDKFIVLLKHYGAPLGLMALSTAGIIMIFCSKNKEISGLVAAAAAGERVFEQYKEKVVEEIGEKKSNAIQDKIAQEIIKDTPVPEKISNQLVINDSSQVLCMDLWSGRYFMSTKQKIEDAKNETNDELFKDSFGTVSLNTFYYYLGLDPIQSGETVGWKQGDGAIKLYFTSDLKDATVPVLAFKFINEPTPTYKY